MIRLHILLTEAHLFGYGLEVVGKLSSGSVLVETKVVPCIGRCSQHPSHLLLSGRATCGDKHCLCRIDLILRHGIVATLKPEYLFGLTERFARKVGNPQSFAGIASLGLALVGSRSVEPWSATFLETYHLVVIRFDKRERKVGERESVGAVLGSQHEMLVEGILRVEVDAPVLEVRIELALARSVLCVEAVDVVVGKNKRLCSFRL